VFPVCCCCENCCCAEFGQAIPKVCTTRNATPCFSSTSSRWVERRVGSKLSARTALGSASPQAQRDSTQPWSSGTVRGTQPRARRAKARIASSEQHVPRSNEVIDPSNGAVTECVVAIPSPVDARWCIEGWSGGRKTSPTQCRTWVRESDWANCRLASEHERHRYPPL